MEHNLIWLCEIVNRDELEKFLKKQHPNLKEAESTIEKTKYWLNQNKINIPKKLVSWKNLKNYRYIRNSIVHNDATIEWPDNSQIKENFSKFIETESKIEIDINGKIIVSNDGLLIFLKSIKAFFKEIKKPMQQWAEKQDQS